MLVYMHEVRIAHVLGAISEYALLHFRNQVNILRRVMWHAIHIMSKVVFHLE